MKEQKTLTVTDILGDAVNTPLLCNEEEICMAKKVREGDEAAIEEFKQRNARFVAAVAKQYIDRGMTIDELMEAGYEVLLIGRQLPESAEVERPYPTHRMVLRHRRGPLFYAEFNIALANYLRSQA